MSELVRLALWLAACYTIFKSIRSVNMQAYRILAVDDDASILNIIETTLSQEGYLSLIHI